MTDKTIRTIRAPHGKDRPYFSMSRAAAQDETLSWEARGMLAYLLSKPDDWEVRPADLQQQCGRDRVYRVLKELIAAGYIVYEHIRRDDGVFSAAEYRVYETPQTDNFGKPDAPRPEKPDTVKPDTEKPDTYIIESQQNREKNRGESKPPRKSDPLLDSARTDLAEYVYQWRDAHAVKPMLPKRHQWTDAIEDAKSLQEMGCAPTDLAAFVTERQNNGKSTVWKFLMQDIHVWLSRRHSTPKITPIRSDVVYDESSDTTMIWDADEQKWQYTKGRVTA